MTNPYQGQHERRFNPINNTSYQKPFPMDYLKGSYFDEKGILKCELLTTRADELAKMFGEANIAANQLRQLFTQVRAIERQIGKSNFLELVPNIQRLSAIVAYYAGRGKNQNERDNREYLKKFIDVNRVIAEKSENAFKKGFVPHFEAIVAYYKYHFPIKD